MNPIVFIKERIQRNQPMGRFALLLFVLLSIMVTYPFVEDNPWLNKIVVVIGFLTIMSALWAVSDSRLAFVMTAALSIPTLGVNILNTAVDGSEYAYFAIPLAFCFYMLVNIKLLRTVVTAPVVNWDILCGAISVYLLLGMNWTLIYTYLDLFNPGAFSIHTSISSDDGVIGNKDFFFFSFVTLTTLGYGDIVPITVPARVFAVLEAIAGQLYVACIIGKIISVSPLRNVMPPPRQNAKEHLAESIKPKSDHNT